MNTDYSLYILFNSKTRQLTSFTFDISNFPKSILDNMLIKEYKFSSLGLNDENINLNRFKWIGDYDSGKLVDIVLEQKSIVTETELNEKYRSIFNAKYSTETILYELILNADMKTESGKSMQTFLNKVLKRKSDDKEYFKNSNLHIWETESDRSKRQQDAFKV